MLTKLLHILVTVSTKKAYVRSICQKNKEKKQIHNRPLLLDLNCTILRNMACILFCIKYIILYSILFIVKLSVQVIFNACFEISVHIIILARQIIFTP